MTNTGPKTTDNSGSGKPPRSGAQMHSRRILFGAAILVVLLVALLPMRVCKRRPVIRVLGEQTSNLRALKARNTEQKSERMVLFDMVPYDDFVKKSNLDLAGRAGTYDIMLQYPMCLSSYVKNGYIVPVLQYDSAARFSAALCDSLFFLPSWRETSFYRVDAREEPQAYGYPFAANTMLLCYNKRLFSDPAHQSAFHKRFPAQELSPNGMTWERLHAIAEYFSAVPGAEGICMQGQDGGWLFWEWCNFAFGMGGGVMDKEYGWESGKDIPLIIASPKTIAATEYWLSLKPYNSPGLDFFQTGLDQQMEQIRKGKTALAFLWSDVAFELLYGDGGNSSHLEESLGFTVIPGGAPMLAGGFFMVSRYSPHKSEATAFIREMLSVENQVRLALEGLCSPVRATYLRPEVQRLPYSEALRQSLENGRYMLEAGPECEEVASIATKYLQMIWRSEISVDAGLHAAEAEIAAARAAIYDDLKKRP